MADDADFDPSQVFLYTGEGRIPRNVVRAAVHDSVDEIPDRLFEGCDQLESVRLHGGVLRIGWAAFRRCSSLRSFLCPSIGLLRIGNWAFSACSSLRSFRCPSKVTEIGVGAFGECRNLVTVQLPEVLESIEWNTFCDCTSLEGIRIPPSVVQIKSNAFCRCTNLSSVKLCEGLLRIGWSAFEECSSLVNFRIPSSVVEIGEGAFKNCTNLESVQLHEVLPTLWWWRRAFWGCPVSFRFILLERVQVISMDERTRSMFESRLRGMALAITRAQGTREEANAFLEKSARSLGRAREHLTYWELKGAAPVLELALWKAKMEIEGEGGEGARGELGDAGRGRDFNDEAGEDQDPRPFRANCRVTCGAAIVVPEVLKFFTYSTSWPQFDD